MQVDYILFDEERGWNHDLLVRPSLGERSYWPGRPVQLPNYNNVERAVDADERGEFWLTEPYLLPRKHGIGVSMQNRNVGEAVKGLIVFQGTGVQSKRPYDLVIEFELDAALNLQGGPITSFGGRTAAAQAKEDILIHALAWSRLPDSEGWNPRMIGLQVDPSYGSAWSGAGSTVGAAGRVLPPLTAYSTIRGPSIGGFYKPPDPGLVLEQGDAITFDFFNLMTAPRVASLTIIGTAMASIKTP